MKKKKKKNTGERKKKNSDRNNKLKKKKNTHVNYFCTQEKRTTFLAHTNFVFIETRREKLLWVILVYKFCLKATVGRRKKEKRKYREKKN